MTDFSDRPVVGLLSRLRGVQPSSNGWIARCPAHADASPSLAIAEGTDCRALVYCHAGCETTDVLNAINLEHSDLLPRLRAGNRRVVREFPQFMRNAVQVPRAIQPDVDWTYIFRFFQESVTAQLLQQFSETLGLPSNAITEFEVGAAAGDHNGPCLVIPERNANGIPIGLLRRFADGTKLTFPRSHRGLIIPRFCFYRPGPVLIPEGFTDTATLSLLGFPAIGRPSATGGVEHLTTLLSTVNRDVIVVGENDTKPDGRWPGRDGAERVATELTCRLGRTVRWILPPVGAKDVRELYHQAGPESVTRWLLTSNTLS